MNIKPLSGTSQYRSVGQLIGGTLRQDGNGPVIEIMDPANGTVLASFPAADGEQLDEALMHARRGFALWSEEPPHKRCEILREAAGLMRARRLRIGTILSMEQGKTISEARGEVDAAAEVFEWYAEEARRAYGRVIPSRIPDSQFLVTREPVGPVAAFTPWNFPALTPARKIAGALAAGCPIIIKPSEETPATCLEIAECCLEAGVPEQALAVVLGAPVDVSRHLILSEDIRKVSFTGSVEGGRAVAELAARGIKRITLELGGHAPVLVFDDADVEMTAELCARRKFRNAGQVCVSPTRFYAHENIYERFAARFAEVSRSIKVGAGLLPETQMGPLANLRRVEACLRFVEDAVDKGADLLCGGGTAGDGGYYFEPTVLGRTPADAKLLTEEPFGPVAPLMPFRNEEDVLALANSLPVGLSAFAFTGSCSRAMRLGQRLQAGMIGINSFNISAAETPFGGIKESGYGSEGGTEGLDAYLVTKAVSYS